jgi:hypothetical protein
MLIPTKYENLDRNLLVVGSNILSILKKKSLSMDALFVELQKITSIDMDIYLDSLVFLYCAGFIDRQRHYLHVRR